MSVHMLQGVDEGHTILSSPGIFRSRSVVLVWIDRPHNHPNLFRGVRYTCFPKMSHYHLDAYFGLVLRSKIFLDML